MLFALIKDYEEDNFAAFIETLSDDQLLKLINMDSEVLNEICINFKTSYDDAFHKVKSIICEPLDGGRVEVASSIQSEAMHATREKLQSQAQGSGESPDDLSSSLERQGSDLEKMRSLYAKMTKFGNNCEVKSGRYVSESMLAADTIPAEHLVHTKVFEESSMRGDMKAFNSALSKLPEEDINYQDSRANSLMHMASFMANIKAIRFLVQHGVEVDCLNEYGKTPLFILVENDDLDHALKDQAIKYLFLNGAKFDLLDLEGNSLRKVLDTHFPSAKEFLEHPDQLPDLAEFEATIIGDV